MKMFTNSSLSLPIVADFNAPTISRSTRLQRKCACGKMADTKGECGECRKKRLQGKDQNSEVGHSTARGFMESRVSHDFSKVRVYSDTRTTESARDVHGITYAVARDVGIGRGQFPPGTTPEIPPVETQTTPVEKTESPTGGTEPTPMKDTPVQGPAIAVTNGWANPGGKKDRTTVGIGELSSYVVKDFEGGSWKSDDGNGTTVNSVTFRWTASAAGKNKITYTASDGGISSVTMTTEVPSKLAGKKDSDLTFAAGTQGAGMELTVTASPTTVSFQALELMEGTCDASAITGYFSSHAPGSHDAAAGAGKWRQVGPDNDVSDTADSSGHPSPWSKGSYTWSIPVSWRLKGAQTSTAFSANNNQVVSITGTAGTTVVTKLGAKTDPRTP